MSWALNLGFYISYNDVLISGKMLIDCVSHPQHWLTVVSPLLLGGMSNRNQDLVFKRMKLFLCGMYLYLYSLIFLLPLE